MIKILCDRCGKEIKEHGEDIGYIIMGVNVNPIKGIVLMQGEGFNIDSHYCPDCMNEIKVFIQNHENTGLLPVNPPKTVSKSRETESESEKPKQKRRKRIDIGKIMALKNAEWSNVKIADEMGVNPQAVANAIYQYKKKCESV